MSLTKPPYKTLVKAAHTVGKSFVMAGLVSWWFDCFKPSIALTTAPTDRQVKDILWKEIRSQRAAVGLKGFAGAKAPRLELSADHFAHGFTTRDSDAFQGHHGPHILIAFDEAVGVTNDYWEPAETIFQGEGHAWICIFNPTDTSSQAYQEEQNGGWNVITMSALDHPNIAAELAGLPPPYPNAIRLSRLDTLLKQWCTPVKGLRNCTDVEWPPGSGIWLRPGPIAEARLLGRWPSQGTYSVWSDADWIAATKPREHNLAGLMPQVGCDVARFGDDFTSIHVRIGKKSILHETANGLDVQEVAGRLKRIANELGMQYRVNPKVIPIVIDDGGVGGAVLDLRGEYCFLPMNGSWRAQRAHEYPNRRSELWFDTADLARSGEVDISALPTTTLHELRRQAMSPVWKMDNQGRRVVEKKEDTKEKLKRSPDDIDAMNLAYSGSQMIKAPSPLEIRSLTPPHMILKDEKRGAAHRRGMFGCNQKLNTHEKVES